MGNINPAYNDRVRYTLHNDNQGSLVIDAPIGWQTDEKEYARHEQYHGIISSFSNSLKFIGNGKDFIKLVDDIDGINANIVLKREEKHPITDVFTETYRGYLDLSTMEIENKQLSIKFNSGGIEQVLKARESEQVEIDRTTSIDGNSIPSLVPITVALDGRRVFLKSKYEAPITDNWLSLHCESNDGNIRNQTSAFPLNVINKSHEQAQNAQTNVISNENNGTTGMMFFSVNDRSRRLHIVIPKITFFYTIDEVQIDDGSWFQISITKFKNGISYNNPDRIPLFYLNADGMRGNHNRSFSINYDGFIDLGVGESLAIEAWQHVDFHNDNNARLNINLYDIQGSLFIEEDSFFDKSKTNAVLNHELIDRLITIATGKENAFYSDFLGRTDLGYNIDGPGSLLAVAHGFWVRGFDKLPTPAEATAATPKIENLFKPLTTSFKDAITSTDVIHKIGIGIEKFGNKERVRLEKLSFFYNNNVTIRLRNQVKKVKRTKATEYYYSAIEIGFEKGGTYEEACGLDEFNTKSSYTTVINRLKSTYSKISKYRADNYGLEFARRKPKYQYDTEDTPYDNHVFLMDLKRGMSSVFLQRKWQDDFAKAPTGIFDPDSATNLRLSPFNCLLRHSWWFAAGLLKYASDYITYASSVANSQLKTKLIGKPEYAENEKIVNSELMLPRFIPEWIEFEHICDFDVMRQVEGTSIILGKEVKNFYGLVEFINEDNEKEKGFLFNLKPNGKGKWQVLKSNR